MKCASAWLLLSALAAAAGVPSGKPTSGSLPLRFEENEGRSAAPRAEYIARGPDFVLSLAPTENWLAWRTARVHTRLAGANRRAILQPEQRLPGVANYFLGNAAQWRKDVVGYARIRQNQVYDGIDLIFRGGSDSLEYDFVLAPHADPARIRLELTGQDGLSVNREGDLVISTSAGPIQWKRPEIYQENAGKRIGIEGRFVISKRTVSFSVGPYDRSRQLVIDPALGYSTYLGGTGNDYARGIGVDGLGNVYIAGGTSSANLPPFPAFQSANHGGYTDFLGGDAFAAKFSPSGALVYVTYLGGSGNDAALGLSVDPAGNAYLTGFTNSQEFPTAGNPYQPAFGGGGGRSFTVFGDAFIAKLSPAGDQLLYSTYLGGKLDDIGTAIAIDAAGDAYVTGSTISGNFPTTTGAYQTSLHGGDQEPLEPCCGGPFINTGDGFVVKLNPSGSSLTYSTLIGGSSDELASTIALDVSGNVYIGGFTLSSDFPTTAGALQRSFGGVEAQTPYFVTGDGFIAKLNPTLSRLVYSTYFGGSGDEFITGITVDLSGNLYFTGFSSTMNLPTTPGAPQPDYAGYFELPFLIEFLSGDAIVGKLNPSGSSLLYLTYLGGPENDAGWSIATDTAGNAYVAGFTDSTNFPLTQDAMQRTLLGDGGSDPYFLLGDAFLAVVNPTGTGLVYSSYFGGRHDDVALGLALDSAGKIYIAGNTYSADLKTTTGAAQTAFGGAQMGFPELWGDAFYTVFSGFPPEPPAISLVANAEGENPVIAGNTWVEIKGLALAPAGDTRLWQASDFLSGQLPTQLDQVSATVNGKSAYVYYISPTQVNILTPPDPINGPAQVVVTNHGTPAATFTVQGQPIAPSFFVFNGGPYVAAQHSDGSLIGPPALYPGSSTPAKPGETVMIYANGFGPTSQPVVSGAQTQSGTLSPLPVIQIGGINAQVQFAGLNITPGEFQFNVVIPATLGNGDQPITATYGGASTQTGALITIHN